MANGTVYKQILSKMSKIDRTLAKNTKAMEKIAKAFDKNTKAMIKGFKDMNNWKKEDEGNHRIEEKQRKDTLDSQRDLIKIIKKMR